MKAERQLVSHVGTDGTIMSNTNIAVNTNAHFDPLATGHVQQQALIADTLNAPGDIAVQPR